MNQPYQKLEEDEHGVVRFKHNEIVRYILDNGGIDMNKIAMQDFPQDDRAQFAQLIGYSLSGYGDLSYVTDDTYYTASIMYDSDKTEEEAKIEHYESLLGNLRKDVKKITCSLFRMHEDDLNE